MSDTGRAVTVEGAVDPETLGITLPHEHLFSSWGPEKFDPPESAYERKLAREPVSLDNRWFVTGNPTQHRDNLRLDTAGCNFVKIQATNPGQERL